LGPNFTHMEIGTEFNIYVGSVSVSDVASRYTEAIKRLLKYIKSSADLSKIPWLVNTMGFNRGLGIQLLKKSVKLIQPTTFIEIKSRFAKKNYEISLSKVAGKATFFTFQAIPESSEVKEMGVQDIWGIPEPYKLRDIVILSYLGHHFESSLQESVPFSVSFDNVSIQTLNCSRPRKQKESVMPMLNMSLVSLGTYYSVNVNLFEAREVIILAIGEKIDILPFLHFRIWGRKKLHLCRFSQEDPFSATFQHDIPQIALWTPTT
jgi:hypothetical protein